VYGHLATAHKIKHAITSRIEGGVGNVRDERRWRSAPEHPRLSVPALFPFFYFKNKKWGKEKKWEDLVHSRPTTTTTMAMTAISMTLSVKSSAPHPGSQLLPTLVWL